MELIANLRQYLLDVLGEEIAPQSMEKTKIAGLPVYLAHLYSPYRIHLFGQIIILALVQGSEEVSPARLEADLDRLRNVVDHNVAFVLPELKPYERKRLVEKGIPFIVPSRQMFLPPLLIDLQEYFPKFPKDKPEKMGWTTQIVLIRHILLADIEKRSLTELAKMMGYSVMSFSRSLEELVLLDLCKSASQKSSKYFQFTEKHRDLWTRALPHLRSPVKKRYPVFNVKTDDFTIMRAGMTALSDYTRIAADKIPTTAMRDKDVRKHLETGEVIGCRFEEEAGLLMEGWAYDPKMLSSKAIVDPLSLYLSLRTDHDERVQMALEELLENWL